MYEASLTCYIPLTNYANASVHLWIRKYAHDNNTYVSAISSNKQLYVLIAPDNPVLIDNLDKNNLIAINNGANGLSICDNTTNEIYFLLRRIWTDLRDDDRLDCSAVIYSHYQHIAAELFEHYNEAPPLVFK